MSGAGETARRDDRHQALFETAPIALLATDASLKILEANSAAARVFGVELRHLVGKPLAVFVEPSERRAFRRWQLEHRRAFGRHTIELTLRRRNQVLFVARLEMVAGDGECYWAIADRTETALAEKQLWELNRELEGRVAAQAAERQALVDRLPVGVALVRTDGSVGWLNPAAATILGTAASRRLAEFEAVRRALAGEPGARTVETVETDDGARFVEVVAASVPGGDAVAVVEDLTERHRVERANVEFVQNAAHQLRTPIAAVTAAVEALTAGAADEPVERERFLAHIGREGNRMALVLEALLTLASIDRGGVALTEVVPLRRLLQAVADSVGGPIAVRSGPRLAVVGDRDLIAQALRNVMANAVSHGDGANVVVTARARGDRVHIDVADEGPGIPPELRERVFERFYSGQGRGSGLGLPIARAAAEATGGTLELLPGDGSGARFRFTFPGARSL